MSERPIVVVGGGIVGLSCAWFLQARGRDVIVLEQRTIDGSASTGNAGLIAIGHAPMPKPGLVRQGLAMMMDPTGPLYVKPRFDPALFRWMFEFRRACRPEHFAKSMEALAGLGHGVIEAFETMIDDADVSCEYARHGWLDVFRTEDGAARIAREAEHERRCGFTVELLSGDELRAREPVFGDDVVGASHHLDCATANPRAFMLGLAERLGDAVREQCGAAAFDIGPSGLRAVMTTSGERIDADCAVLAAGAWTSELARSAGLSIPMQGGKGYHVTVSNPGLKTASVLNETYVACTPMDGRLQLAGTVELSGINDRLERRRLDMLVRGARVFFGDIDEEDVRDDWCGLRPCTADGLPVIGWTGVPGVIAATGHAMMGFCLGPVTGQIVTALAMGETPTIDISAFDPARYG